MCLSIEEAEEEFQNLLYRVEPKSVADFLSWINESFVVSDERCILNHLCSFLYIFWRIAQKFALKLLNAGICELFRSSEQRKY